MSYNDEKEALLEQLHRRFGAIIERKCAAILADAAEAQDAKQETFLVAYRKLDSFVIKEGLGHLPWLYAIANNVCLHVLRKRRKYRMEISYSNVESLEPADTLHPERLVNNSRLLSKIFSKLDKRSKQVFIAYFMDGMTQEQVALVCGITRRTVANRLAKIKKCARPYVDSEAQNG